MISIARTLLAVPFLVVAGAHSADVKLDSDDAKTMYALGQSVAANLAVFGLSEADLQAFDAGLTDGILKRDSKVDLKVFGPKIQQLAQARSSATAAGEKEACEEFLKKAEAEKGAVKTGSGLVFTEITPGSGPAPTADKTVKVHYHGTLRDGTVFDSSVQRSSPATFPLKQVIPCWTEGLQRMHVGGKAKLVCPSAIAYGDRGAPPVIKPGATLVFEVQLLEIVK